MQGGSDGLSGKPEDTSSFSDETLGWLNLHFEPNLHLWVFRKYCKVWDSNELENDQIHTKREKKKKLQILLTGQSGSPGLSGGVSLVTTFGT